MLDPYPWGAGVTSLEAFSLAIPVITLPSHQTVLPLVLGQLRAMGLEGGEGGMVARNAQDYVRLATRVAKGE